MPRYLDVKRGILYDEKPKNQQGNIIELPHWSRTLGLLTLRRRNTSANKNEIGFYIDIKMGEEIENDGTLDLNHHSNQFFVRLAKPSQITGSVAKNIMDTRRTYF